MKQLWAPWRLEYIESADDQEGCVFCRARDGDDEKSLVVHRGKSAFVVLNKYPYASGHLMVAPNRHEGEFGDLEDEETLEIHQLAASGLAALAGIASMLGLGSTDPNKMSEDDAARVMNYARKEHPELIRQTVEEKPWFVKAMGNPVVLGALTVAAAKLLSNRGKKA